MLLAGGRVADAIRLALAMAFLQFSIGTFNDLADAPRDRGRTPPKPVPEGFVSAGVARVVGTCFAVAGLLLAIPSGLAVSIVAIAGLACGLAYDFALSRTALSWLPLAVALPLVPLFAWLGATGSVTAAGLAILPIGLLAGGGLAVSNALIDLDVDREEGRRTVAVRLGPTAGWWIHAIGLAAAAILVAAILPWDRVIVPAVIAFGAMLLLIGIAAVRWPTHGASRLGWQIEAAGVAVLGVAWGLATAPPG